MCLFQQAESSIKLFDRFTEFYGKYKGRLVTVIIPVVISFLILICTPDCFDKLKIYKTSVDINLVFKCSLCIVSFIFWFIILMMDRHHLKNNTVRYGIGLLFMDSVCKNSTSRKRLIKHLREEMKDYFEIKEYNKSNLKKYLKKDDTLKMNTSKKLNLWAIIQVSEEHSGVDNIPSYILTIEDHNFSVNVNNKKYEDEILFNLNFDISNVLKKEYIISDRNSYNDSIDNSKILHIELNYILAITLIVSKGPTDAFPILNNILEQLIDCNNVTSEIKYIFKNIVSRLLEAVGNSIAIIDNKKKMTLEDAENLRSLCDTFYEIYNEPKVTNYVDKYEFIDLYPIVVLCRVVNLFYDGLFDELEKCLKTCYPEFDPHIFFFKFLSEAVNGNYSAAFSLIKKVKFRKDLDDSIICYMIGFVENWYKREKSEASLFCFALINKYFGDYSLYEDIRMILLHINEDLGKYLKIQKKYLTRRGCNHKH